MGIESYLEATMNDTVKLVAGADLREGARLGLWQGVRTVAEVWPHYHHKAYRVLLLDDGSELTVTPDESWRDRGDGVIVPVHLWFTLKL